MTTEPGSVPPMKVESVQRGIKSRVHHHGYYAPMEDYSLDIRRYVRERLGPDLCTR